jgi:hypothetical protein
MCKNMKKILAVAIVILVGTAMFTSCKSSSKCAAYGETQKFQKEVRY